MSTQSMCWYTYCCNRQSQRFGCKGFIGRRQMLDMCGDFQGTLYCSVDSPYHFKKKLNMRKGSAHRVSHTLSEIGKWQQMETARMHWEPYEHEGDAFLHRIMTVDETWIGPMFVYT